MASTYDGNPSESPKDAVRFLVGDTGPEFDLNDDEIAWLLSEHGDSVWLAAAAAARRLAMDYTTRASSRQVGPLRVELREKAAELLALAADLERRARDAVPMPWAGGLSKTERDADREDDDLVQPRFHREHLLHPSADDLEGS